MAKIWSDKYGRVVSIGAYVDVPNPSSTKSSDFWKFSFSGKVVFIRPNGFALVEDKEENVFEIECKRIEVNI